MSSRGIELFRALDSADFNSDGHVDIAVSYDYNGSIELLLNDGSGSNFTPIWQRPNPQYTTFNIHSGDFNRDGIQDLYLGTFDGLMDVILGDNQGGFSPYWSNTIPGGYSGHLADFNMDGCMDIVAGEHGMVRLFESQ